MKTMKNSSVSPSICITIDYELFGDGSGDVQAHILQPTEQLLTFFEVKGIKATFFVEVAELLVFAKTVHAAKGASTLRNDYDAICRQLEKIVREGHDIQLHIHPQWLDAHWNGERWVFSSESYSLLQWGVEPFKDFLRQGRTFLESIGQEVSANYACRVFRAGGLHFDRSCEVGHALLDCGLLLDSSVCRGFHRQTRYANIDYRDLLEVPLPYWPTIDGRVAASAKNNALWEVPVWAVQQPQWRKLTPNRLRNKLQLDNSTASLRLQQSIGQNMAQAEIPRNPLKLLFWFMERKPLIWDFCLMTGQQLIHAIKLALNFHDVDRFFPLVMLGHTKEVQSLSPLERLHAHLNDEGVDWITMSQVLNRVAS